MRNIGTGPWSDLIDSSDEWIRERSGIIERRFAGPDEGIIEMTEWAAQPALEMAGIEGKDLDAVIMATVTWPYQTPAAAPLLAERLGLDVVEHVEPRPGIPPNPHHVTHVLDVAKQDHVKAILQEAFYPAKTSEMIAKQAGLTVLRLPAAPNFKGGEGYIEHMSRVVNALAKVYQ